MGSGAMVTWGGVVLGAAGLVLGASSVEARMTYGPINLSGNIETQNIFRVPDLDDWSFVQQRNTLRLEYDHHLIEDDKLLGKVKVPFLQSAKLFLYYRGVYDSIYDIAPGQFLEANDGSRGPRIADVPRGSRSAVAYENNLREAYIDLTFKGLTALNVRLGKQQIVWGNANLNQRGLDSVNALDLTWHFNVEAGLLGRVGFSELRRTAWTARAIYNLGDVFGLSNAFLEGYVIPNDFKFTKLRFLPRPWSLPARDPARGGMAVPVDTPLGPVFLQPCFDLTGNSLPNGEGGFTQDFSETNESGKCPTEGLQQSKFTQGIYDRRDPADTIQVGGRFGAQGPLAINFTLSYMYRRSLLDVVGTAASKQPAAAAIDEDPIPFVEIDPHTTFDNATGQSTDTLGYIRIPLEFYHPYVHVFGASADIFDQWVTNAVINAEMAWTHDNPINSRNLAKDPNTIRKTDLVSGALSFDRPTWIPFLNRGRTVDVTGQVNVAWQPFHEDVKRDPMTGEVTQGFVTAAPFSTTIPGQIRDEATFDRLKRVEILTAIVMNTTYMGGTLIPVLAIINDWTTAPVQRVSMIVQYLATPYLVFEPQLHIWWTNGKTVDDRFSQGRLRRRDELVLKMTYQF